MNSDAQKLLEAGRNIREALGIDAGTGATAANLL
jgi:hypothetical protein